MYIESLESPIGEDEEDSLGELITDEHAPSPTKEAYEQFMSEELDRALNRLSKREKEILVLRYGIKDGRGRTLKEVGQVFNITRQRVHQIEKQALEKIKYPIDPSRKKEMDRFR